MNNRYADYLNWLYEQTGFGSDPKRPDLSYTELAIQLFETPFTYFVYNDDNRAADGVSLRDFVFQEDLIITPPADDPCNMLELFVALAARADFAAENLGIAEDAGAWVRLIFTNLGLNEFTDEVYASQIGVSAGVDSIIDNLLARNYLYDGLGGMFPLKQANQDQTKVEIWYQLEAYIQENADFSDSVAEDEDDD